MEVGWDEVRARRLARSSLTSARAATGSSRSSAPCAACRPSCSRPPSCSSPPGSTGRRRPTSGRRCGSERALVKAWTLRGTLHLHPAGELALWYAARRAAALGREGLPAWRDPAARAPPGARRRRGRSRSGGGLGGARRPLPLTRRARGGGRGARRSRARKRAFARASPSSSRPVPGAAAGDADHARAARISGSRARGRWTSERRCGRSAAGSCAPTARPARPTSPSGSPRRTVAMRGLCSTSLGAELEEIDVDGRRSSSWPATGRSRRRALGCGCCRSTTST